LRDREIIFMAFTVSRRSLHLNLQRILSRPVLPIIKLSLVLVMDYKAE
jgi:hypothetical protein